MTRRVAIAGACLMCMPLSLHAQVERVNTVIAEQVKAEEAARAAEKRISQLDTETSGMLGEYRQMSAEAASLKSYNEQLATQVGSQQEEIAALARQIGEVETTSREVLPMMQRMLATLEQFVKLDLPFLPQERSARTSQLKDMITRADVSISEKYRRIVEAYQIETEYGRTLEGYQGRIGDKTVDFLRVGRVALMYQTLDGKESGYWDATAGKWKPDNRFDDAIKEGLKVARKQSAPDFVAVPVRAPKEARP
jgi:seryl-tRNA synthetase